MPRGKKKFALIWWIESKEKDVVPLSLIPKKQQQLNCIVKLTWRNYKSREDIKADAKLLMISGKYLFLQVFSNE